MLDITCSLPYLGDMRAITEREYIHERLGDEFAEALSWYDTSRRLEVLVGQFLGRERLAGRQALDVGAGLGFFSEQMQGLGASVTATDIGPNLLEAVARRVGCRCERVDALTLLDHFGPAAFDVVISSECIEHTPDPLEAVRQMAGVLRPGGWLAISTPNLAWYPIVYAATKLRLRPFDGLENFSTFGSLVRVMKESGMEVVAERGLHLFPFQLRLHSLSRWCDNHLQVLKRGMINICILAQKRA